MWYETGISPSHFILRTFLQVSFSSGSRFPCVCLCFRGICCTSSLSTLCTSYFNDLCLPYHTFINRSHPAFRHQQIISRSKEVVGYSRHSTCDQFVHPSDIFGCYSIYCLLCLFATSPTKHVSLGISCISMHSRHNDGHSITTFSDVTICNTGIVLVICTLSTTLLDNQLL